MPTYQLEPGFVDEVAAGREIALPKLAGIDAVLLGDAAVLGNLVTKIPFTIERARGAHQIVGDVPAVYVCQTLIDGGILVRRQIRSLELSPWAACRIHVEVEVRIVQLEAG